MSVGTLLLLALLVCAPLVAAGRRFVLYPAPLREWRFTFGGERRDTRRRLRRARRRLRLVLYGHRRDRGMAEKNVKAVDKAWRKQIRRLERKQGKLLGAHRGRLVDELGALRLYQHQLIVLTEDPTEGGRPEEEDTMPLTGISVTFGSVPDYSYIEITKQDGRPRTVSYPSDYDPSNVKAFEGTIKHQIVNDREYWNQQYAEAERIDSEIAEAEADRAAAVTAAETERDDLIRYQATEPKLAEANQAWESACDAWEQLTGQRPPWPWWWCW